MVVDINDFDEVFLMRNINKIKMDFHVYRDSDTSKNKMSILFSKVKFF
jgi:hypothetical protein